MKTIGKTLMIALATMMIYALPPFANKAISQPGYYENNYSVGAAGEVSFGVFYNALAPYGRWMNHREFGLVWMPNVGKNFHPYLTDGYWVMTNYGNTWVSDFEWGWAPFHYGRWYYDDIYGWAWIPGYEWAPAWVVWRNGGGFYGWAPLGPRVQLSVHIQLPSFYWVFLPAKYLYHPHVHKYYKPYTPAIYNRTTIINHIHIHNNNKYYSGPAPRDYRKETGYNVKIHQVTNASRPGRSTVSNRSVSLYRPEISKNNNNGKTTNRSGLSGNSGRSTTTNRTETGKTATKENTTTVNPGRTGNKGINNRSSENSASEKSIFNIRNSKPTETIKRSEGRSSNSGSSTSSRSSNGSQNRNARSSNGSQNRSARSGK